MKELKIIAGFFFSFLAVVAVFGIATSLYHDKASVTGVAIVMGLSAVLLAGGLLLLESARAYKSSKVVQLVFALSLILLAWDPASLGMRRHRYTVTSDDQQEIPMTAEEMKPVMVSTIVSLSYAIIVFALAFLRRPINPTATRIFKLALGLIILLIAVASAHEASTVWKERGEAEMGIAIKVVYVFVVGTLVTGLGLLMSGALPSSKKEKGKREGRYRQD